ncbi:NADH:flavin oxidoreductase [Bradyrhizobium prioriisuperbiae]|uniref:NADH:flavin oxidoreductase n=1 Tax=Bradyrhizobium prioriisuperbiae TaxID=2854389 RepID=UPI0028E3B083|nr:NADH:flavin oxidoreductase [Bradyrhizobium prioritasuperba]
MIAFYAERARGGTGLLVVEATYVDEIGRRLRFNSMLHDDHFIPGMRRLVESIHAGGAKAALQIAHGGRESRTEITGHVPVAPSPIISLYTSVGAPALPREMMVEEIQSVVSAFADAAERARQAGFDAVELHGAHAYLTGQFLSPVANRREDDYGGSVEKRSRFYVEILRAIKTRLGEDYPVICRMNGSTCSRAALRSLRPSRPLAFSSGPARMRSASRRAFTRRALTQSSLA